MIVTIYDSGGVPIKILYDGPANNDPGSFGFSQEPFQADGNSKEDITGIGLALSWDGKDSTNVLVAAGVYYLKFETKASDGSSRTDTKPLTVLTKSGGFGEGTVLGPNPASQELVIMPRGVPMGCRLDISVYNIAGQAVRQMSLDMSASTRLVWGLDTPSGKPLADGLYVLVMQLGAGPWGTADRKVFKFAIIRK